MKRVFRMAAVLITVLSVLLVLTGCDSMDYKKAMELYESGEYAQAEAIFAELADYEDSADMVLVCRYAQAQEQMDAGEYAGAAELFESLGDYEDSTEQAKACRYAQAEACVAEGKYDEALELFAQLDDYRDSEAYLQVLPGYEFIQWLQNNGEQEYVCSDPAYTVTVSADGQDGLTILYEIGSSGDDWVLNSVFTAEVTLGSSEAFLTGEGYMGISTAYMDDIGTAHWNIENYIPGDSVRWETYELEGRQITGAPLASDAEGIAKSDGLIGTSLERMTEALDWVLEQSGLDVTMANVGFASYA